MIPITKPPSNNKFKRPLKETPPNRLRPIHTTMEVENHRNNVCQNLPKTIGENIPSAFQSKYIKTKNLQLCMTLNELSHFLLKSYMNSLVANLLHYIWKKPFIGGGFPIKNGRKKWQ
jgi:hypothetical protein